MPIASPSRLVLMFLAPCSLGLSLTISMAYDSSDELYDQTAIKIAIDTKAWCKSKCRFEISVRVGKPLRFSERWKFHELRCGRTVQNVTTKKAMEYRWCLWSVFKMTLNCANVPILSGLLGHLEEFRHVIAQGARQQVRRGAGL